MITSPILWMSTAAIGACCGSFCTTAALRAARAEPYLTGRSHCDACDMPLGLARTVPLVSYIQSAGRCAGCRSPIVSAHPVGELAGLLIACAALAQADVIHGMLIAILGATLLTTAIIDLKTQRLPDGLTLSVALAGLVGVSLDGIGTLLFGLACAGVAFLVLEGLRRAFFWGRKENGLGLGDVKLVTALAIWLGLVTPWMLALASIAGLIAVSLSRPKEGRLAFGPYIAAAGFVLIAARGWSWPA